MYLSEVQDITRIMSTKFIFLQQRQKDNHHLHVKTFTLASTAAVLFNSSHILFEGKDTEPMRGKIRLKDEHAI